MHLEGEYADIYLRDSKLLIRKELKGNRIDFTRICCICCLHWWTFRWRISWNIGIHSLGVGRLQIVVSLSWYVTYVVLETHNLLSLVWWVPSNLVSFLCTFQRTWWSWPHCYSRLLLGNRITTSHDRPRPHGWQKLAKSNQFQFKKIHVEPNGWILEITRLCWQVKAGTHTHPTQFLVSVQYSGTSNNWIAKEDGPSPKNTWQAINV